MNWLPFRNKYGNKKIATNEGKFDSRLELNQYNQLKWMERARRIKWLQRQVRIKLGTSDKCKVHYVADFCYFDNELQIFVIHDSKGFETPEFKLKAKWLLDCYGGFVFKVAFHNETKYYEPFDNTKPLPPCFTMKRGAK